ncbi:MAG: MBL fold metallo-hydrolase [Gemella sp.]|nr:MBL fold metallo-hydrolase [Gemella sp.]
MFKKFGKIFTSKKENEQLRDSKYYIQGKFRNIEEHPILTEGVTLFDILKEEYIKKKPFVETQPSNEVPFKKTDLFRLAENEEKDYLIWFGHSSYLLSIEGIRFLIDPVLSGNASPIYKGTPAFKGADYYKDSMLPEIDYLLITHDHYDHLDYKTVKNLIPKVKNIVCPLGVAKHLQYWGYEKKVIKELDWGQSLKIKEQMNLSFEMTNHSSGRLLKFDQSLWGSYILQSKGKNIYLGGDSCYGEHYKKQGEKYGNFDLVLLENGQYNKLWKYSHLFPEETLQAAKDLNAKYLFPIHNSKFKLSSHAWNEPLKEVVRINKEKFNINLVTPQIGEVLYLDELNREFSSWYE